MSTLLDETAADVPVRDITVNLSRLAAAPQGLLLPVLISHTGTCVLCVFIFNIVVYEIDSTLCLFLMCSAVREL